MSAPLRTWDVRVWTLSDDVEPDARDPMLVAFLDDVRALAREHYPAISVRWITERKSRDGGPRIHVPPRDLDNGAATEAAGGSTT